MSEINWKVYQTMDTKLKESITVDEVVEFLNQAIATDAEAIHNLCNIRFQCNETLANHPTIQVQSYKTDSGLFRVGFLGVLNGLFGIDARTGFGSIAGVFGVWCAKGCEVSEEKVVGDDCEECGRTLRLGKLIKFIKVDHSELPSLTTQEE
jgi:hypothetical protein